MDQKGFSYSKVVLGSVERGVHEGYHCSAQYTAVHCTEEKGGHTWDKCTAKKPEDVVAGFCSRTFGCGAGGLVGWRTRYVLLLSWLWALYLGPLTGWIAASCIVDNSFQILAISTSIFFTATMVAVVRPSSSQVSRLWILSGLIWLSCGWVRYCNSVFGEDLHNFYTLMLISSVLWGASVFLPLLVTDPCFYPRVVDEDDGNYA